MPRVRPAVPSAVLYEVSTPVTGCPKALGQCIPRSPDRCTSREGRAVPPASGGWGLEWVTRSAHANPRQASSRMNRPKVLTGLIAAGTGAPFSPVMGTQRCRRSLRGPKSLVVTTAEHGKPVRSPFGVGRPQGPTKAVWVEDGGESERPAVTVGIRVATSLDAKAGRLPPGLSSRERMINRLRRQSR
jgi:hypothetical protein